MLKKVLLAATAVGMLSACAARWDVEGVAGLPVQGGAFNEALHKEYVDLASAERAEYDWSDAEFFLGKARAAAAGENVLPQEIAGRDLPAPQAELLGSARAALITRLDANGRSGKPATAARAQTGFDCWMQEQEEGHQPIDIAACRQVYDEAMNALEPTPAPASKAAVDTGPFIVFFENASARIDASARDVLNAAARSYGSAAPVTVVISGHTDTTGADQLNMLLSQRRAEAVADALSMLGVPPRDMALEAYGEEQLKIKTPNAVAEPRNRRVEVIFRKPAN
jgi:outer membrane protein OmpA-like peptidoglycan-associated protein